MTPGCQSVHNGISKSRFIDVILPGGHRQLGSDNDRFFSVAILHHLQQRQLNIFVEVLDAKVVKDNQRDLLQLVQELHIASFRLSHDNSFNQPISGSKGRKQRYYYYHCSSTCDIRYRADLANTEFIREMKKYVPHPAALELHKKVIREGYAYQMKDLKDNRKMMIQRMSELNNRVSSARELLLSGVIEATDFRTITMDCEKQMTNLEVKMSATAKG